MDVSFGTIWEAIAREQPDRAAISEPGRDYTYAEFEDRAARLAAALTAHGFVPGDKVACYLYNGAAYLETVFAAFKIGAGSGERELPLHATRADRAAGRRRRRRRGVQRRARGQRGARRPHAPVAAAARPGGRVGARRQADAQKLRRTCTPGLLPARPSPAPAQTSSSCTRAAPPASPRG